MGSECRPDVAAIRRHYAAFPDNVAVARLAEDVVDVSMERGKATKAVLHELLVERAGEANAEAAICAALARLDPRDLALASASERFDPRVRGLAREVAAYPRPAPDTSLGPYGDLERLNRRSARARAAVAGVCIASTIALIATQSVIVFELLLKESHAPDSLASIGRYAVLVVLVIATSVPAGFWIGRFVVVLAEHWFGYRPPLGLIFRPFGRPASARFLRGLANANPALYWLTLADGELGRTPGSGHARRRTLTRVAMLLAVAGIWALAAAMIGPSQSGAFAYYAGAVLFHWYLLTQWTYGVDHTESLASIRALVLRLQRGDGVGRRLLMRRNAPDPLRCGHDVWFDAIQTLLRHSAMVVVDATGIDAAAAQRVLSASDRTKLKGLERELRELRDHPGGPGCAVFYDADDATMQDPDVRARVAELLPGAASIEWYKAGMYARRHAEALAHAFANRPEEPPAPPESRWQRVQAATVRTVRDLALGE